MFPITLSTSILGFLSGKNAPAGTDIQNCLLLFSLIIFSVGFCFAVIEKKKGKIPWQSFLLIMLILTAFSMWLTVLPRTEGGEFIYKALYAAFYVMESAVGNQSYELFENAFPPFSLWRIYTIFLHLLMPVTAYGVILSYFLKAFGWFRYTLFRMNRKVILFSELTEKSKAYAGRIRAKKTLLVFANTQDGEKENFEEDNSQNMVFTDQSEIQVLKQMRKRNLTIMEMGEDENRNLLRSVEIIRYLKGQKDISPEDEESINIYTVSHQPEAATILDNVIGRGDPRLFSGIKLTVINEFKRIAFKLFYDHPLTDLVTEETKCLDIMIIGFGRMGQEILKTVSWAGTFPKIDVNVHVISLRGVENGKRLLSSCPELGVDLRHENGFQNPGNGCQLNEKAPIYYYSVETDSDEFDEIIRKLFFCRYIVVSLGDDIVTLSRAIQVYRLIMRERLLNGGDFEQPKIHVRIRDNENMKMLLTEADSLIFSNLIPFGSDADIYSEDMVGESELDHLAKRIHEIYLETQKNKNEITKYDHLPENKKNSNQAQALHTLYKLRLCKNIAFEKLPSGLPDEEIEAAYENSKKVYEENVSDEERLQLAEWEHTRWQADKRTEGFSGCSYDATKKVYDRFFEGDWESAAKKTRQYLLDAHIHPCIGDVDPHLRQISLLLKDPKDPDAFFKNDCAFVNSAPEILKGLYRIVPKNPSRED